MSIDDVDASQYMKADEDVMGIDDGDEYESLKIFIRKTFVNDSDMYDACMTVIQ